MTSTEVDGPAYIALGTTSLPYFLARGSLEEVRSALVSSDLIDQGQLHPEIDVFDSCGAKVENPLASEEHEWPCEPPPNKERVAFHARCAAVLATLAARTADQISGLHFTSMEPSGRLGCGATCYLSGRPCRR